MLGTVISIIVMLYLQFAPSIAGEGLPPVILGSIMVCIGIIFLFLQMMLLGMSLSPLQRAEHETTPRILEIFEKDGFVKGINGWILVFTILSIAFSIDLIFLHNIRAHLLVSVWVVMLGLSYDALLLLVKRFLQYYNPFQVLDLVLHSAKKSIQEEHEIDLCHWIDALAEISIRAIQRANSTLSIEANDRLQLIVKHFFESSKSISHHTQDSQTRKLGISDKASYILFFVLQRLEIINDRALEKRLDLINQNFINVFGKIVFYAAKFDMTMPTHPIQYLGKSILKAINNKIPEAGIKGSIMFLEVSKLIINDVDLTYAEIKEPFLNIVSYMDMIAKESFRQDRKASIPLLTQYLRELKDAFASPKVTINQDTPAIIADIDRVLAEFDILDSVIKTMPPMPPMPEIPKDLIAGY